MSKFLTNHTKCISVTSSSVFHEPYCSEMNWASWEDFTAEITYPFLQMKVRKVSEEARVSWPFQMESFTVYVYVCSS